jgi:hypothetical protein
VHNSVVRSYRIVHDMTWHGIALHTGLPSSSRSRPSVRLVERVFAFVRGRAKQGMESMAPAKTPRARSTADGIGWATFLFASTNCRVQSRKVQEACLTQGVLAFMAPFVPFCGRVRLLSFPFYQGHGQGREREGMDVL